MRLDALRRSRKAGSLGCIKCATRRRLDALKASQKVSEKPRLENDLCGNCGHARACHFAEPENYGVNILTPDKPAVVSPFLKNEREAKGLHEGQCNNVWRHGKAVGCDCTEWREPND